MSNILPVVSTLTAIISGVTYPMSDYTVLLTGAGGPVHLYYLADDNLGMAPLERFSERGPAQHGDTDTGMRLEPRPIVLVFGMLGTSWQDLEQARRILLRRFTPRLKISWRWTQADFVSRQIDTYFSGGLQFGTQDRDTGTWFQRFTLTCRADDPTFYDPSTQSSIFGIPNDSGFVVPMFVPFSVGASNLVQTATIAYTGTWDSYPTIRIDGPITAPRIENQATGEVLSFPTTIIPSGVYYLIDLRYGAKTIIDNSGVNRIGELSSDSDLATWHLAPAEDGTESRANVITVTGSGITADTLFNVIYSRRYLGV